GVRRPVVAGVVESVGESPAVGVRTREHVVLVRHVAEAVDHLALLGERGGLADGVAVARLVAMQIGDIAGDQLTLGVVPGAGPDAATCVYAGRVALRLLAQISVPRLAARAGRGGEVLANLVRARKAAEIA